MVKKLTISIPDDLHRKLDQYRDRIAISSVCAGAIRTSINDIEECIKEAKKRFYLLSIEEASDIAYQKGIHWAGYEATPEEIAYMAEWKYNFEGTLFEKLVNSNDKIMNMAFDNDGNLESLYDFIINEEYLSDIIITFLNDDFDYAHILEDFLRGVRVVWNEIKEELLPKLCNPEDDNLSYDNNNR